MTRMAAVLGVGATIMAAAIAYAFLAGDLWNEARVMLPLPWFHLSMIDLYVGFLLFGGWIIFRERRIGVAIAWVVAVLLLGNLASCGYALIAALRSEGSWQRFWLGARSEKPGERSLNH